MENYNYKSQFVKIEVLAISHRSHCIFIKSCHILISGPPLTYFESGFNSKTVCTKMSYTEIKFTKIWNLFKNGCDPFE